MPQIAVFRSGLINIPKPNVEGAGRAGLQIQRAGMIISQAGDQLQEWEEARRKAEQVSQKQTAVTNIDTDLDTFLGTMLEETDHTKIMPAMDAMAKQVREQYRDKYGQDPVVWKAIEPVMENKIANTAIRLRARERSLFIDEKRGQLTTNMGEWAKGYAALEDPQQLRIRKESIAMQLAESVSAGIIKASERDEMLQSLDRQRDVFRVDMLIDANPEVAYAALKKKGEDGQFSEFTYLTPEQRAQKLKAAESATYTRLARIERQEKEIREDVLINIYSRLNVKNPDYAGIKADMEKLKERDPVTGIRPLAASSYHAINAHIEQQLKGGGIAVKTDNAEYWRLLKGITAEGGPTVSGDDIIAAERKGKLSSSDTQELLRASVAAMKGQDRKLTREESAFDKAKKQRVQDILSHLIDTSIPNSGDTKELNGLISRRIVEYGNLVASSGDLTKDLKKIDDYAYDMVKWAKQGTKKAAQILFEKALTPLTEIGFKGQLLQEKAQNTMLPAQQQPMSEATIRQQLALKGIRNQKEQDEWIAKYRAAGIIK